MLGLIARFPSFFLDHYIPSLFGSYKYNHVRKFRLRSLAPFSILLDPCNPLALANWSPHLFLSSTTQIMGSAL